jgi:hypothetical protein
MAASFPFDCPHPTCLVRNAAFQAFTSRRNPVHAAFWNLIAACPVCGNCVILVLLPKEGRFARVDPSRTPPDEQDDLLGDWNVVETHPQPPAPRMVASAPPDVQVIFAEAETAFTGGAPTLAAIGYRTVVERVIGHLAPDAKGKLYHRIEALGTVLPPTLIAALHEARLLGNDGAHDRNLTADELQEGRDLVNLFLIYAFDMPERLARAKAARDTH